MITTDDSGAERVVRGDLELVLAIGEHVNECPGHHAEPTSDLAVDETRFPDVWAATVARRGMVYAVENVEAACTLVLNDQWTTPQFALLRTAYESASTSVWLLDPDDVDTRLARFSVPA